MTVSICAFICCNLLADTNKKYSYSKTPKKEAKEIIQIWARVLKGENVSKKDAKKVEKSFKKKIAERPDDLRGYQALALLYERTGQIDKALDAYKKSFGDNINSPKAYDELGQFFARNKKADLAIQYFEKEIKLEPNNAAFMSNSAGPYLETKQYDKAIEIYKKAMQMDPNNERYHLRLANTYMLSGKEEEAIIECEKILKKKPGQKQAEAMLNHLYKKLGKGDVHPLTTAGQMKEGMKEQGYHASVQQVGNVIISTPTYYKEGKAPISELERKVFNEYKETVNRTVANLTLEEEKRQARDAVAAKIAKKYNMTTENFVYMTLKIMRNEVVPDTYIAPSGKDATMEDVTKDKFEVMTSAERTATLRSWDAKTDFEKLQKSALMAEANKDYKNAVILYKEILSMEDTPKDLVPMMHCALQRCYEKLGDTVNEKTELVWINNNIFAKKGGYNRMIKYLTGSTTTNLDNRMKRFSIHSNHISKTGNR